MSGGSRAVPGITGRGGPGGDSDDESRGGKGAGSNSGPADNSDNAILQSFVDRYGPTILAAPTMSGFNLTAWITPFAVLLAAFASAVLVVHSWKKRPLRAIASAPQNAAPYLEEVRRETEL